MLRVQRGAGGAADYLHQLRSPKRHRIRETLRYALRTVAVISLFWTALSLAVPNLYIYIFTTPTAEVLRIAPAIIRRYSISFVLLPLNIFSTYYFQALLKPAVSFVVSVSRGAIISGILMYSARSVGLLIISTHFVFQKGDLRIRKYKIQCKLYRKIFFRGLPEAIAQFSTPVTTLCMNYTLMAAFGDIGINAFSIISYLSSFTMAVFFGASEGMQPLFGQAYGAKEDDDLKHYYRAGQLISIIGSALCVAVYVIFPHVLCKLFGADAETLDFTAIHMREYCWGFVVGSANTRLSAYFYSTKRSGQAIVLNIVRSLILNTLIIMLLPKIFGSGIVWHTFGIYEVLVLIVAVTLKKHSERNGIIYR